MPMLCLAHNERKNMCPMCVQNAEKLPMIKVVIDLLCDDHYFDWANEKICYDLDTREDYFHLV